jgi:hypothetical protein
MREAVDDKLMREIVEDNTKSWARPAEPERPRRQGSGYADAVPLSHPPGVAICDQLVDQQDRQDLIERAERLARQKGG